MLEVKVARCLISSSTGPAAARPTLSRRKGSSPKRNAPGRKDNGTDLASCFTRPRGVRRRAMFGRSQGGPRADHVASRSCRDVVQGQPLPEALLNGREWGQNDGCRLLGEEHRSRQQARPPRGIRAQPPPHRLGPLEEGDDGRRRRCRIDSNSSIATIAVVAGNVKRLGAQIGHVMVVLISGSCPGFRVPRLSGPETKPRGANA